MAHHLHELMGDTGAQVVEGLIRSAADQQSGRIAAVIGIVVLLVSASSVFTEVQTALNVIWRARSTGTRHLDPPATGTSWSASGWCSAPGCCCSASLVATAVMAAVTTWATELVPQTSNVIGLTNFALSFGMTALVFAGIYKALPNRHIGWRDVGVGALVTAFLFTAGKWLIGFYIGTTGIASTYGAAGALMAVPPAGSTTRRRSSCSGGVHQGLGRHAGQHRGAGSAGGGSRSIPAGGSGAATGRARRPRSARRR